MIVRRVDIDKMPASCKCCKFGIITCKFTGASICEEHNYHRHSSCPLIYISDGKEGEDVEPIIQRVRMEKLDRLSTNGYAFKNWHRFDDERLNTCRNYKMFRGNEPLGLVLCMKESGRPLYQIKQRRDVLWETSSQSLMAEWLLEYIIRKAMALAQELSHHYPIFNDTIFDGDVPIIAERLDHFILVSNQSDILKITHDFAQKGFRVAGSVLIENEDKSYTGLELVKGEQL